MNEDAQQVVTRQPAISLSNSFHFLFNRAGGRTSNVLPEIMHLFPPSPKNTAAAISYVKSIPRKSGATDLQALRNSAMGAIGVIPLFFYIMASRLQGGSSDADAILAVVFGALGIATMILVYRTLALLDLFTTANLPQLESSPDNNIS